VIAPLPPAARTGIEVVLSEQAGEPIRITSTVPVGGGCISPGARISTDAGRPWFVKWSAAGTAPRFFAEEARSLRMLAAAGAVRVPAVVAHDTDWLLLEWLEPGRAAARAWEELGHGLARLHGGAAFEPGFGWPADNYIGTLPQTNRWSDDWPAFWLECRLGPQWERARRNGLFESPDQRSFDALAARRDTLLEAGNRDGPSLLHGDLWGGNVHFVEDGTAALIDPSSSFGHREVDLAMAHLFGGFDRTFFAAYREAWPLEADFEATRRPLYQLYYVLVHVNLFGSSYIGQARRLLHGFD